MQSELTQTMKRVNYSIILLALAGCTVGGEPALDNTMESASSCSGEGCKTSSQSKHAFSSCSPEDFKAVLKRKALRMNVAEPSDKCCRTFFVNTTSGVNMFVQDSNCVDNVNNMCRGGRVLTACKGCNFVGNDDCSPNDGGGTGWVDGTCNGFSYQVVSGKLVSDDCSTAGCAPGNDAGICTFDWPGDNACPTIALTQNYSFDGANAWMCCETRQRHHPAT